MKNSERKSALAAALGVSALAASSIASAGVLSANWTGYFIMLDPVGSALANTSIAKTSNQFVTPISGTLQFDDVTGAGIASLAAFDFLSNGPDTPAILTDINLQAIGNGMGGPGALVLANMLFNWNANNGIPVSLVLDAAGFFANELTPGGANSAVAATDGTYVGILPGFYQDVNGYLAMGPMPMVTTAWNTSLIPDCVVDFCMDVNPSGLLPLVLDTTPNEAYDVVANTGALSGTWDSYGSVYGIGGNPMVDGPFMSYNLNLDFATITYTGYDPNAMLPNCDNGCPSEVPVPVAAWLFGSGLLGFMGFARRRVG